MNKFRLIGTLIALILMFATVTLADIPAPKTVEVGADDWLYILRGVMVIGGTAFLCVWLSRRYRSRQSK